MLMLDLGLVHLVERVAQRLDGALHVGLHDKVQVGLLALLDAVEQVVQVHVRLGLLLGQTRTQRALLGQLAGIALVLEHAELVAGDRDAVQAQDLDRVGRRSALDMLTARVDQRTDASVGRAGDDSVARMQRAALHEHGGHRAAALVEVGLDDEAGGQRIGVSAKLEHVGLQQDGLEQVVDVQLLLRRNVDEHVLSAPVLGDDAVLDELLAHAVGVGAGLVDLVDGHHDRHVCGLGVVDGLDGLRHDAVVGGDDQDDDVGHLGTAGAHGREGFVAGRVDEGDLTIADAHDRGADVLRDAAGLALGDAGVADGVEQRRLAVVDVAHDGDDGRTRLEVLVAIVVDDGELLFGGHYANLAAHIVGDELDELVGHGLREREHLAEHEQALDDVVGLHAEKLGELGHRGTLRDLDDGIVEHEAGIEAALDGLHLHALAGLGLALLLALLAAALALMGVGGGDGGTRLGEHLVALQLLGLHGHLGVTVLARWPAASSSGTCCSTCMPFLPCLRAPRCCLLASAPRAGCSAFCFSMRCFSDSIWESRLIEAETCGCAEHRRLALGGRGCGLVGRALAVARCAGPLRRPASWRLPWPWRRRGHEPCASAASRAARSFSDSIWLARLSNADEGLLSQPSLCPRWLDGGVGLRAAGPPFSARLARSASRRRALLLDGLAAGALSLGLLALGLGALLGELLGLLGREARPHAP